MKGPVPKPSSERRRRNLPEPGQEIRTIMGVSGKAKIPPVPRHWHPIARRWYRSLAQSAQSQFYEASDWAQAQLVGETMTRMLDDDKLQASLLVAVQSSMTELLTSEGARRRARIEIQRNAPEKPASSAADDYRHRLGVA